MQRGFSPIRIVRRNRTPKAPQRASRRHPVPGRDLGIASSFQFGGERRADFPAVEEGVVVRIGESLPCLLTCAIGKLARGGEGSGCGCRSIAENWLPDAGWWASAGGQLLGTKVPDTGGSGDDIEGRMVTELMAMASQLSKNSEASLSWGSTGEPIRA